MQKEKRRPTFEQLREMGPDGWRLEVAQIGEDAAFIEGGHLIRQKATELLLMPDNELTPEKVMALRVMCNRAPNWETAAVQEMMEGMSAAGA